MVKEYVTSLIKTLHRERVFALILAVVVLIFLGAGVFALVEPGEGATWLERFGRGAWWALVTLTTVGYGDVVPVTFIGRVAGFFVILGGVISLSLVTATVASVFIERKFRRERGLEPVKVSQHILILGWSEEAETLLDQLLKRLSPDIPVVLVNKQPPEQMEALLDRYLTKPPIFLRGEYSREEVLFKANVRQAVRAIILAERQAGETATEVDQRTLFTALTLKAVNPKIRILAELLHSENRPHLERAGAEDVLIRGQYDSSLLAGAIASPGIYRVLTTLLVAEGQNLWDVEIPGGFHGRSLSEFAAYLREQHQSILIAIYTEARALSLGDLLGEEPSAINDFIRRKFAETKMTHLLGRTKVDYQINPPGNTILGPRQFAVVIAPQRPEL
ncbi:MAG: potassium channel family protein [Deltaproteobacteria bacterium]|nr:potassium channel family protein [Deltaproteobacteria bacterium]